MFWGSSGRQLVAWISSTRRCALHAEGEGHGVKVWGIPSLGTEEQRAVMEDRGGGERGCDAHKGAWKLTTVAVAS